MRVLRPCDLAHTGADSRDELAAAVDLDPWMPSFHFGHAAMPDQYRQIAAGVSTLCR